MILVQNDLMKDPVWYTLVGKEVHTQLHAATRVLVYSIFISDINLLKHLESWKRNFPSHYLNSSLQGPENQTF